LTRKLSKSLLTTRAANLKNDLDPTGCHIYIALLVTNNTFYALCSCIECV